VRSKASSPTKNDESNPVATTSPRPVPRLVIPVPQARTLPLLLLSPVEVSSTVGPQRRKSAGRDVLSVEYQEAQRYVQWRVMPDRPWTGFVLYPGTNRVRTVISLAGKPLPPAPFAIFQEPQTSRSRATDVRLSTDAGHPYMSTARSTTPFSAVRVRLVDWPRSGCPS
jgi:hypothetical protein